MRISNTAASYDSRFEKTIDQLISHIQKRKNWISTNWADDDNDDAKEHLGKTVRLLDYACGTGMVSRVRSHPPCS